MSIARFVVASLFDCLFDRCFSFDLTLSLCLIWVWCWVVVVGSVCWGLWVGSLFGCWVVVLRMDGSYENLWICQPNLKANPAQPTCTNLP